MRINFRYFDYLIDHFAYKYPHPSLPKHKLYYLLIDTMAETFLRPVRDAVKREYDYIIVGGGTAGLVVATRLTEDPSVSVIVLEAGRANLNDDSITMSGTFGKNFFQPDYEWGFMTVPQKHSSDTPFFWPRGKGLGGSSCINFYLFARPPASDIDGTLTLSGRIHRYWLCSFCASD